MTCHDMLFYTNNNLSSPVPILFRRLQREEQNFLALRIRAV